MRATLGATAPVHDNTKENAVSAIQRDMKAVFAETETPGDSIRLAKDSDLQPERFCLQVHDNEILLTAADMGLIISHHHAEPLGAKMFVQAYPELEPKFSLYPEKFRALWQDAITAQKATPTIWNIGFRGQGDKPFWEDEPQYDTPEKRGALISSLIREQYDLVKQNDPNAICCTNLYGETMELYQQG